MPDATNQSTPAMPIVKPVLSSPWELFKQAADRYSAQFKPFAMLALISILGSVPLIVLTGMLGFQSGGKNPEFTPATLAAFLAALVLAIVVGVIAMCALYLRNESSAEERIGATLAKARLFFWPFIGASLLAALVIGLFSILLIVPGIIFAVYYSLVEYPVLFEGMGPRKALGRSKQLVKGYWWAVMGRGAFLGLAFVAVAIVFGLVGMVFKEGELGFTIWQMLQNVSFAFLWPLAVIYEYQIFKELKAIKGARTIGAE